MNKGMYAGVVLFFLAVTGWYAVDAGLFDARFSDTEPEFDPVPTVIPGNLPAMEFEEEESATTTAVISLPAIPEPMQNGRVRWASYWVDMTPEELAVYGTAPTRSGPPRVGIQAGHWNLAEVPEELDGLKASSGAQGGGYSEQDTVLEIARRVKALLEAEGVTVDLIDATVPVDYLADAFVSIHADGSTSANVSGYKLSAPRRDFSGKAEALTDAIYESYGEVTGMRRDGSITRRMSGYYAFNWRRYDHAVHPQTPSTIVETGFMTNAADRAIIVSKPQIAAEGIAEGIIRFLNIR